MVICFAHNVHRVMLAALSLHNAVIRRAMLTCFATMLLFVSKVYFLAFLIRPWTGEKGLIIDIILLYSSVDKIFFYIYRGFHHSIYPSQLLS